MNFGIFQNILKLNQYLNTRKTFMFLLYTLLFLIWLVYEEDHSIKYYKYVLQD